MTNPLFAQPAPYFHQPDWVEESGKPYPGAEGVAEAIAVNEEQTRLAALAEMEKEKALARRKGQALADEEQSSLRKLVATPAHKYGAGRPKWLWAPGEKQEGRIPLAEMTIIVGRGSVGKSTLTCQMAAWITTGDMQGEYYGQPRDVLFVINEDNIKTTVNPKLIAAGADLNRVHYLAADLEGEESPIMLPRDCDDIGRLATELGAVAIIIDPLSSNLTVDNINDQKKMRTALQHVRKMAENWQIAVIGLAHTRKAPSTQIMDSIMGSSEIGNVCRSAMALMANDAEEKEVVLSQAKLNNGNLNIPSYVFALDEFEFLHDGEMIKAPKLRFLRKTMDENVNDMMAEAAAAPGVGRGVVAEARDFIRAYLIDHDGEATRKDVVNAAKSEGMNHGAIDRAIRSMPDVTVERAHSGPGKVFRYVPGPSSQVSTGTL